MHSNRRSYVRRQKRRKIRLGRGLRRALRAVAQGATAKQAAQGVRAKLRAEIKRARLPRQDRRAGRVARLLGAVLGGIHRGYWERSYAGVEAERMGMMRSQPAELTPEDALRVYQAAQAGLAALQAGKRSNQESP